ncbi:hypothetical protein [Erythrobacter rubeus]|uniref:hypothetical protein n=1 Tax=Erythrobacter rubeus TaxID=2760803 RepID=UPI001F331154|nr:hypothetical protein [Erythrobacter rubeus]
MADKNLLGRANGEKSAQGFPPEGAPLGGTRAEAIQRLQIGFFGLFAMVLLVGLASIIGGQAELNDQTAVPEAAPTTEPTEAAPQRDPLVDAGVVPDIPAEPSPDTEESGEGGAGSGAQPESSAPPGDVEFP